MRSLSSIAKGRETINSWTSSTLLCAFVFVLSVYAFYAKVPFPPAACSVHLASSTLLATTWATRSLDLLFGRPYILFGKSAFCTSCTRYVNKKVIYCTQTDRSNIHILFYHTPSRVSGRAAPYLISPRFLQARERLERRRVARLNCGDAPPPSLTFIHGARAPALQPLRQTPLRVGIAKLGGVEVLVTRAR